MSVTQLSENFNLIAMNSWNCLSFKCYLLYSLYMLCICTQVTDYFLFKLAKKLLNTKRMIITNQQKQSQRYLYQ